MGAFLLFKVFVFYLYFLVFGFNDLVTFFNSLQASGHKVHAGDLALFSNLLYAKFKIVTLVFVLILITVMLLVSFILNEL